jgi:hypothetical protein
MDAGTRSECPMGVTQASGSARSFSISSLSCAGVVMDEYRERTVPFCQLGGRRWGNEDVSPDMVNGKGG